MRAVFILLAVAAGLGACSGPGYLMRLREDKADRTALVRAVAGRPAGAPFAARVALAKPWTRLWVFGDTATTQGIEDRIGVPFPRSDQPVARGASYLVFVDATRVLASFSLPAGGRVSATCLQSRRPLTPATRLVRLAAAPRAVAVAGAEARCATPPAG